MAVTVYNKTKTGDYNISALQREINGDAGIVPSCLSITATGTNLDVEMADALSAGEETTLDGIISAHVPPIEEIAVTQLPFSDIDDGKKLAVHPTYKPRIDDGETFAVWCGSGDNPSTGDIGDGDLLEFDCTIGTAEVSKDMHFHPDNGQVWIHEGYLKFEGGGAGDYLCASFMAAATPLQQVANLDLEITDNWIHLAAGGPGTGTDGFADGDKIALIPRYFSKDGDWDYDETNGLTPNVGGTGLYKISDIERTVHTFINKIPCRGSSTTYFSMSSDETAALAPNYFIRITAYNVSDTNWNASALVEIYRERTAKP